MIDDKKLICPNCGEEGPHWVDFPPPLGERLSGTEDDGFWVCSKYYGEDGRRLPIGSERK